MRRRVGFAHLRLLRGLLVMLLSPSLAQPAWAAASNAQGVGEIRGVVLEAHDGAPVAQVLVRLQGTDRSVTTDDSGRFELAGIDAGPHELYVSVVDFILVKHQLTVTAGTSTSVTIVLTEGIGVFSQAVTVTGRAGATTESGAPSARLLQSRDLQQLRGLITNDPLRAIQVLPGVATGDDLKSEFTVRGHSIDHMVFSFEGIATPLLVHTVQRVNDTGSLAMINGDVLDEITLAGGAYPQRHGDRLGATLDFRMREGSRDRTQGRVSISGTDSALVTEGPIGRARRGSWLTSIRKSYLDLITSRLDTDVDFTFGFVDLQAKAVYDVNPANQIQFALAAGRSRLKLDPADVDPDDPQDARNGMALGILSWRQLFSPTLALSQRLAVGVSDYRNASVAGVELARGSGRDVIYRADGSYAWRGISAIEAGAEIRSSQQRRDDVAILSSTRTDAREHFDDDGVTSAAFAQVTFRGNRWNLAPGLRLDHWTLTGETTGSPWVRSRVAIGRRLAVSAATGVARQRPTIDQLVGLRGTRDLQSEVAYHGETGIEGELAAGLRWQATIYAREERRVVRLPDREYRVVGSLLLTPSITSRYRNSLSGHARGVELTLERRGANGLTGWASYSFGGSEYRDVVSNETFWGDFDQRHTLNAYGLYRFSNRFSLSGRFRHGSNFPTPGYWVERNGAHAIGTERNTLRVPAYARLDARLNRTFEKRRTRLTLFVEVLNALNRDNVRAAVPSVSRRTGVVQNLYDPLFPRIPSAGLLVEF